MFKKMFDIEFDPKRRDNYPPKKESAHVFYLNLSEMKSNQSYERECIEKLRDVNFERRVVCFEYCNPRIQEIDQNIRELWKLVDDIDSVVYLFYVNSNDYENEHGVEFTKQSLINQMNEFIECRYIDDLQNKVFVLNEMFRFEEGHNKIWS